MKTNEFNKYLNEVLYNETKKIIKEQVNENDLIEKIKSFQTLSNLVNKISVIKKLPNGFFILIKNITNDELMSCCGGVTPEESQKKLLQGLHYDMEEMGLGDNMDLDLSMDGSNNIFNVQIKVTTNDNGILGNDEDLNEYFPASNDDIKTPKSIDKKKKEKLILGDKQMNENYDELSSDENDELNDKWNQWEKDADDEWNEREDEKWNQLSNKEKFEELFSIGGNGFKILNMNDFDYVDTKENDRIIAIGVEPYKPSSHKPDSLENLLSDLQIYIPEIEIIGQTKHRYAPELKGTTYIGIRKEINEQKNMKNKKVVRMTESPFVKFINKIIIESEDKNQPFSKTVGKKNERTSDQSVPGVKVTKTAQNTSKKETGEHLQNVNKKMKDYLSFDGNDNPEFPKQIGKGEKVARKNTPEQEQEIDDNRGRGPQDLDYDTDFAEKQVDRIKKALSGDSTMGNEQDKDTANVIKSDVGKKMEKNAKRRIDIKKEEPLYNKEAVPTKTKKQGLNEDIEKIKNLYTYNKVTQ